MPPLPVRLVTETQWWVHLEVTKRCQVDLPKGTWQVGLDRTGGAASLDWVILTLPDGRRLQLTAHEWQQGVKHAKYRRRAQRLAERLVRLAAQAEQ